MFFAKATACHRLESALPPLQCASCAHWTPSHLLLRRRRRRRHLSRRRLVVWEKHYATPSLLELDSPLTKLEGGGGKLVHVLMKTRWTGLG
jgi:hypothetical protein